MQEIAAFAGEDAGVRQIYTGVAALYGDLVADQAGARHSIQALDAFLNTP